MSVLIILSYIFSAAAIGFAIYADIQSRRARRHADRVEAALAKLRELRAKTPMERMAEDVNRAARRAAQQIERNMRGRS